MNLTERQKQMIAIVKKEGPITAHKIAEILGYSRSTLRSDLNILTHLNIFEAKTKVGYVLNEEPMVQNQGKIPQFSFPVKKVKSPAVCITENSSVYESIVQMFLHDAGTIFVVDENEYLSGIVSRKDFLKSILGHVQIQDIPVGVIMTRMPNIIITTDEETILEAAKKIIHHKIDALPVVEQVGEGQYRITGRISKTTLSNLFLDIGQERM